MVVIKVQNHTTIETLLPPVFSLVTIIAYRFFFERDRYIVRHYIITNNIEALKEEVKIHLILVQITNFANLASENNCADTTASLLECQNKNLITLFRSQSLLLIEVKNCCAF